MHWDPALLGITWNPIWDPGLIWNPDLGPQYGTPIWDPDLGLQFEALIWDSQYGPPFWIPNIDPEY
jgi:hypothetical protein